MRALPLASVILCTTGCKTFETTINQTGTGHTATVAEKPGTMATAPGATAVEVEKPEAPVQTGTGNAATDNIKAGQRGGAAATAPHAQATATMKKGGTPFWLWLLVFGAGFATRQSGPWLLRQVVPGLKLLSQGGI